MFIQIVPPQNVVFSELAPVFSKIYTAVDVGAQHVQEYRDWQKVPLDPVLAPDLLRSRAKRYLIELGHEAADLEREDIPNNGLLLAYGRYSISIMKSDDGGPPPPGRSARKQAFYDQRHLVDPAQLVLPFPEVNLVFPEHLNVVITWSVNKDYVLTGLVLSVPKHGALTRASVEMFWSGPIPPPGVGVAPSPPDTSPPTDLPITLLTEQKTG